MGKKPAPGDHESGLKIFLATLFLARCPCVPKNVPFRVSSIYLDLSVYAKVKDQTEYQND